MKVDILDTKGASTGSSMELPTEIFGVEPNEHAVYLAVKQYNAAQRQGTHKAKERGEIAGSTRKIKKQKGTGTARAGSIKNPIFRGGGRIFGPRPRNYNIKLNKKVKALARVSALSHKANNGDLKVVDNIKFDAIKTKDFVQLMTDMGFSNEKCLFVLGDYDKNVYYSARNLPNVKVVSAADLNTYDILNAKNIVMTTDAVAKLEEQHA